MIDTFKIDAERKAVLHAVVTHYMRHATPAKVEDIVPITGWSETKVRRVINEAHGSVPGTVYTIPGYITRPKGAWLPDYQTMRKMIFEASRKCERCYGVDNASERGCDGH